MSEFDEMNETPMEPIAEEQAEVVEEAAVDAAEEVVADDTSAEESEDSQEAAEAAEEKAVTDDDLFDKVNRAARLLRNRRDMLRDEREEQASRLSDLVRALKVLELKPRMEQRELADLLGMRLREVDAMMQKAEANDLVGRVEPEEPDMRKVVVFAEEGAAERATEADEEQTRLVPELTEEKLEQLVAALDEIIEPLTELGCENDRRDDRGPRGGFGDRGPRRDDRGGRGGFGDRGGRGGFGGHRDDRGPRRDFGDRGPRRDDRGGRGGFDRGPRRDDRGPRRDFGDRGPRRDFGGRDDRGPRRDFGDRGPRHDDRGGRGGYGHRDDRGPRRDFGGRDDRGPRRDFGDRGPRRDDRGGYRGGNDRGGYRR